MKYNKALRIGRARAEEAAGALQRWAGIKACPLCAVRPAVGTDPQTPGDWEPVGRQSLKEIARDDGMRGGGNYHLFIVDEKDAIKACSMERFPLGEVLRLAERLPCRVASPGEGELWKCLEEEDLRIDARHHALHVDV